VEALHKPPGTMGWQSASQLARAASVEIGKRLLGELVKSARRGVPLDPLVETRCLEFIQAGAELRNLICRQFG